MTVDPMAFATGSQGTFLSSANEDDDGMVAMNETHQGPEEAVAIPESHENDLVVERIETLVCTLVDVLDDQRMPVITNIPSSIEEGELEGSASSITKTFQFHQCRSFTSILMVLDFCHALLLSRRTTTTREVYYHYVTHFRNQAECDKAILDAACLVQVPRHGLGLTASPRGWYCGDLQLMDENDEVIWDGRYLQSVHGAPIGSEWLRRPTQSRVHTCAAICLLVIEKEGVYNRLVEDRFFDDYPCILVTGKGFPDVATRALVHYLHHALDGLPVWGLSDGNPYGSLVLNTYQYSQRRSLDGGHHYSVPMQWIGLRSSQMERWRRHEQLPNAVYQALTELDERRLRSLLDDESDYCWTAGGHNEERMEELEQLLHHGYKMELEALNWLGMDYLTIWLGEVFGYNRMVQENFSNEVDIEIESKPWLEII